jgi:cleavage and polyadenylation specificity factor subunit 1
MQLGSQKLLVDASSGVLRPLVPPPYRRAIFEAVHNVAHTGIRASRRLISSRFVWLRLAADAAQWCENCTQCHKSKPANKPANKPAAAVQPLPVPLARFLEVHIDIVGPLPATIEGFQYLLTVIDR